MCVSKKAKFKNYIICVYARIVTPFGHKVNVQCGIKSWDIYANDNFVRF